MIERLQELAGFPIVPGTLNVRLPRPLERGSDWRYVPAAEIGADWEERTGQAGYFLASVTIAGRYRGLAFQADELGTGFGDRFEDVEGRSGPVEEGVRLADEVT